MLKTYTLYIVNTKSGKCKDVTLRAYSSEHARHLYETMCVKEDEKVMSTYPTIA